MAGRHGSKRNQRSSRAKTRRRQIAGWGTGAGAVLAFGMGPLASAPPAQADVFDVIIDPLINAIGGSMGSVMDPLASLGAIGGLDPFSSLDLSSLSSALPALEIPGLDAAGTGASAASSIDPLAMFGSLDPLTAFGSADPLTSLGALDPLTALTSADPLTGLGSATDPGALFNELIYTPIHGIEQAWITNPLGEQVDNMINQFYSPFFGGQELIGNGANGVEGSATLAGASGGNGGLFFGDGGNGAHRRCRCGRHRRQRRDLRHRQRRHGRRRRRRRGRR